MFLPMVSGRQARQEAGRRLRLVAVRSYPLGPRVWVLNQRIHHGATGCVILAAAAIARKRARPLIAAGIALALHDRHDWRVWFARESIESTRCVTNVTDSAPQGVYVRAIPTNRGGS